MPAVLRNSALNDKCQTTDRLSGRESRGFRPDPFFRALLGRGAQKRCVHFISGAVAGANANFPQLLVRNHGSFMSLQLELVVDLQTPLAHVANGRYGYSAGVETLAKF